MQRVFALLAVLSAASAASSRPRVLVSLHANGTFQLEMNQAELHEILGKARNVAVVGGYGMGSGMSTLFNAAALAAEDSTLLGSGFPVAAPSRKAAIWIQRPGLLAPNVVFLSCENCYEQFNTSWAAAMHLFHIMHLACQRTQVKCTRKKPCKPSYYLNRTHSTKVTRRLQNLRFSSEFNSKTRNSLKNRCLYKRNPV
ncbi:hypothetical protein DIPPA_27320 [Diplonema papillatum]|nr:hypothetical protein DIPPA_27320 [Diplonema papillatum]